MKRPIIYPPTPAQVLQVGERIKDEAHRAGYFALYLTGARVGELFAQTITTRKISTPKDGGGFSQRRERLPPEEVRVFPGLTIEGYTILPDGRPALGMLTLKRKGRPGKVAPLTINPKNPDLFGQPPANVLEFYQRDCRMAAHVTSWIMKVDESADPETPVFPFGAKSFYEFCRGKSTKQGYREGGLEFDLLQEQTEVAGFLGQVREARTLNPHLLRSARVTHLLELGLRLESIQKLTNHANLKSVQAYERLSPVSKALRF